MKTVKRKAKAGERILIVNPYDAPYEEGAIFEVDYLGTLDNPVVKISEERMTVMHSEYEVIVEDDPKSAWILAPADITHGALKGQRGTVVAYDSQTGEVKLKVDERTLVILHVDWIDQSRYLSGEFSK